MKDIKIKIKRLNIFFFIDQFIKNNVTPFTR